MLGCVLFGGLWSAPVCVCRGVAGAGPGAELGSREEAPPPGRVPSLACGQGWGGNECGQKAVG